MSSRSDRPGGPSGTGKTHVALGLGLAACQKGLSVGFTVAAALVHALMEARDERRLLRLQKSMADHKLLIIDELGFVPMSKTGAELLFELISQRYERGATLITSNLPFDEWTETFGSDRLTGAAQQADTSRQHPRDERRQLPPRPKPRPQGQGRGRGKPATAGFSNHGAGTAEILREPTCRTQPSPTKRVSNRERSARLARGCRGARHRQGPCAPPRGRLRPSLTAAVRDARKKR